MKYFCVIFALLVICSSAASQSSAYAFRQLEQLDSIGKSPSISRHFGKLYFDFLLLVESKLSHSDSSTRRLVRHFEMVFAQFFIDACIAFRDHREIPLPAWRTYFADTSLQPAQYYLLGANAHLNGGLAEAISGSYTPGEWAQVKKKYFLFNSCLNQTYRYVYSETIHTIKKAKSMDALMLGLDKYLGEYYLYKWRKRQMRDTGYYFAGSLKFEKLYSKIERKKKYIDRLVLTYL